MHMLHYLDRLDAWCGSLTSGGLSLDSAPWIEAEVPGLIRQTILRLGYQSSLVICRSGEACERVLAEFTKPTDGQVLDAAVFPSRAPYGMSGQDGNCHLFDDVQRSQSLGLPPIKSVCDVCPFETGCEYFGQLDLARSAAHGIMTAARAEFTDLEKEAKSKDAVFIINGRALDVFVPTVQVFLSLDQAHLDLDTLGKVSWQCLRRALSDRDI